MTPGAGLTVWRKEGEVFVRGEGTTVRQHYGKDATRDLILLARRAEAS